MVHTAKVVMVDGKAMAQITRTDACAKCGACHFGHEEARLYPLPEGAYRPGDTVEVRVPDQGALPAALLAYGIPLGALLLGLVLATALGLAEWIQVAAALAGLGLGYLLLKLLDPILRRSGRFQWRTMPCQKETPDK